MFPTFVVKVAVLDDFNTEPHPLKAEAIELKKKSSSESSSKSGFYVPFIFFPLFFFGGRSNTQVTSNTEAFEASKKIVSCGLCYPVLRGQQLFLENANKHPPLSPSIGLQVFEGPPGSSRVHV